MTREERRRERDRRLLRAMARHGIVEPRTTLRIARRVNREQGHMPLSRACALLEKETAGGANVWGHDKDRHGCIPPCGGQVTRANYAAYKKRRRKDRRQQGCGPTQLTFFAFQDEADRHGGCWRPNINMYVGFSHLAMNIKANGVHGGMRRYNGSGPAAEAYAHDLRRKEARWRAIFAAAVGKPVPVGASKSVASKSVARPFLSRGDKGGAVIVMTRRLSFVSSRKSGTPYLDGKRSVFDREAEQALKRFQSEHGLETDGRFGRNSAKKLAKTVAAEKKRRRAAAKAPVSPAVGGPAADPTLPAKAGATMSESADLLALLERLEARGDRVLAALLERRHKLEGALEHERLQRQQIEAQLQPVSPAVVAPQAPAPQPPATQPPAPQPQAPQPPAPQPPAPQPPAPQPPAAQPSRTLDDLLKDFGSRLESTLDRERQERVSADAELRALVDARSAVADLHSRLESLLDRERQERVSADGDLRALIDAHPAGAASDAPQRGQPVKPAESAATANPTPSGQPAPVPPAGAGGVTGSSARYQSSQSAVPMPGGGLAVGSAPKPVPGPGPNGDPRDPSGAGAEVGGTRAGDGNASPPSAAPLATEPGSPGGQVSLPGPEQPVGDPSVEKLTQRLGELSDEEDRIRLLLHKGYADLEARFVGERQARRDAEARLRTARGLPPEPEEPGKSKVTHPDVLKPKVLTKRPSKGVDKRWSKNRVPHRRLYSGTRGLDVAQLQHALNKRLKARSEFGYKLIRADGEFGPATRRAWIAMARAIGLSHRKCSVGAQILMRNPAKRGPSMVKKGKAVLARARAALKRKRAAGGGGARAVAFLVKRAGWTERPSGSNDARFLANWRRDLHQGWMRGQPWCGFACRAAWHYGAGKNLPPDTVSTVAIANRARSGNGYTRVGLGSIKAGDLVVFHMGSGGPKHVGLARGPMRGGVVPTVEGNTSASNSGSQSNGGGIFLRTRSRGLIHTVARPK